MAERSERWLESSDVVPMFPSMVWQLQIEAGLRDAIAARVEPLLAELRRGLPPLQPGQGWQSPQALHERPECAELKACIERALASVLRFLRIVNADCVITACWATVLAPGAAHRRHSHPNNYLSGVYYLRVPAGAECISFHDPRPQASVIRPPVVELTGENTDQVVLRVRPGTLLLFPAFLEHSVDANASNEERSSLSFNAMFPAYAETLARPLWSAGPDQAGNSPPSL